MEAGAAIAEILKREGVEIIFGYPVNHIIEFAARADIRPIIVRQERIGLHMADAISRLTSGEKIGVFAMQHGPGAENAYGGVAQAYGECRADPGAADGLSAPHRARAAELQLVHPDAGRHQVGRAGHHGRRDPEHPAARLHAAAQRPRRARCWSRSRSTCSPRRSGPLDYRPMPAAALRPRPAMRCARRQGAWSRPSGR